MRFAAGLLLVLAASAQDDLTIRTRVNLVVAPTTVVDAKGKFVDGLTVDDFMVLDGGKRQSIRMDTSDTALTPISIVVVVQSNGFSGPALAKIRKVGSMVEPLITGEKGEAAILRYSDEVDVLEDFTADADRITKAFRALKSRGDGARTIDAVVRAMEMLRERPQDRRKIVLVISESRDRGSEAKLEDVLKAAQRENVTIYSLNFSVHAGAWTAKPQDAPSVSSGYGPIIQTIIELARLGKVNTAEEMARFTGGRRVSFLTLNALERDLAQVGEELHSQYLISFAPSQREGDAGFHTVEVSVKGRPELLVRTRPGYWAAESGSDRR